MVLDGLRAVPNYIVIYLRRGNLPFSIVTKLHEDNMPNTVIT